jgi:FAD/FMN-containing dehydrogenase
LAHSAETFRRLIDIAIENGGSYYLTYHRHARRDQVLACHPSLPEMLRKKREYDPEERFQSEWYRWYRELFADA